MQKIKKTIAIAKKELETDVGIFYHVDAGITVIGPAPEGCEIRGEYYDESGSLLLCRGIAKADDPDPVYAMAFQFSEHIHHSKPAETPESFYEADEWEAKMADDFCSDNNYSDE